MRLKSHKKVKQQRRVLLLALYILKKRHGVSAPPKKQVIGFIEIHRLMHVPEGDLLLRSSGEPVWKNDLSWKREDLKENGLLQMPQHGVWQLTKLGEQEVEAWALRVKEVTEKRPDWAKEMKVQSEQENEVSGDFHFEFYITENTVREALKIALELGVSSKNHS